MENQAPMVKGRIIKSLYFYVVSFVALMMIVWSMADVINIALRTWVFTQADKDMYYNNPNSCEVYGGKPAPIVKTDPAPVPAISKEECDKKNEASLKQAEQNRIAQKQRDIVRDISMVLVGIPLFFVHWRIVRRKDEDL